ncbi:unnamed protein product [Hydatigera taeniaeformis]|uniref:Secreted protein n=1 Tax=Hydatigena taeniaeformis TaxID=6205 RepID=A0A0R3WUG2_HYDTA|nr:unnamed protein product [Hydatigera taeniaeformis]
MHSVSTILGLLLFLNLTSHTTLSVVVMDDKIASSAEEDVEAVEDVDESEVIDEGDAMDVVLMPVKWRRISKPSCEYRKHRPTKIRPLPPPTHSHRRRPRSPA